MHLYSGGFDGCSSHSSGIVAHSAAKGEMGPIYSKHRNGLRIGRVGVDVYVCEESVAILSVRAYVEQAEIPSPNAPTL